MRTSTCILVFLLLAPSIALAATPPDTVNYQGVLRDAAGDPLGGSHDFTFRYHDAPAGGTEIMFEEHLAAGTGAVVATNGLVDVVLGTGNMVDGAGPDAYTSLSQMLRDYADVWIQIEIGGEVLSPRMSIVATPLALNARQLGGQGPEFVAWDETEMRFESSGNLAIGGVLAITDFLDDEPVTYNRIGTGIPTVASDSGDLYIGGDVETRDDLWVGSNLYINHDGPNADQFIWFHSRGFANGESLSWDLAADRFEFSATVWSPVVSATDVVATNTVSAPVVSGSDVIADATFPRITLKSTSDGQIFSEFVANQTNLIISDQPRGRAVIVSEADGIGIGTLTPDPDYDVTVPSLRVDGLAALDGFLYLRDDGPDQLQSIYFWDGNNPSNEWLSWEDSNDRFELSNSLQIHGPRLDGPAAGNFLVQSSSSMHVEALSNARTMFDADNSTTGNLAEWFHDGVYSNPAKLAELQEDGDFRIRGAYSNSIAFDIAESFLASEPLEPGDVVRVDPTRPNAVLRTSGSDDRGVLGVISDVPGMLLGGAPFDAEGLRATWGEDVYRRFASDRERIRAGLATAHPGLRDEIEEEFESNLEALALERFFKENLVPVALAGRVPVKVDASRAAIEPGDPLSPGPTPGTAIKADGTGPVIGTALEGLASGAGSVLTFVHRSTPTMEPQLAAKIDELIPDPVTGVQTVTSNLQVVLDRDGTEHSRFSIFRDGEQYGALGAEVFRVDEAGNVYTKGALRPASMDVAEYFALSEPVEPGDVLVVDRETPGRYRRAGTAGDPSVIGVVAAEPGVLLGGEFSRIAMVDPELAGELDLARRLGDRFREAELWDQLEARFHRGHAAVALSGTIEVKVDAGYGAIQPGDLLVASPTAGHAMRGDNPEPGTVVGKALGRLENGQGRVRMLVMLH